MSDQLILGIISDQVILATIGAIVSVFGVFMSYQVARLTKVAKKTHEAVNSLSLILARELAEVTKRLALVEPTASNVEKALDAEKALVQSEAVQEEIKKTM